MPNRCSQRLAQTLTPIKPGISHSDYAHHQENIVERKNIQAQQTTHTAQEQEHIELAQKTTETNQELLTNVDDILAEIDGVLEENAEDFVKGFVQKGGQ